MKAILMEKAFAKFCGSYGALDGGWAVWAWHAMTGDNVLQFRSKLGRAVQVKTRAESATAII
jgi:hypothetical protein